MRMDVTVLGGPMDGREVAIAKGAHYWLDPAPLRPIEQDAIFASATDAPNRYPIMKNSLGKTYAVYPPLHQKIKEAIDRGEQWP